MILFNLMILGNCSRKEIFQVQGNNIIQAREKLCQHYQNKRYYILTEKMEFGEKGIRNE